MSYKMVHDDYVSRYNIFKQGDIVYALTCNQDEVKVYKGIVDQAPYIFDKSYHIKIEGTGKIMQFSESQLYQYKNEEKAMHHAKVVVKEQLNKVLKDIKIYDKKIGKLKKEADRLEKMMQIKVIE